MTATASHFLLYSYASRPTADGAGSWRFVLQAADGSQRLEAADVEAGMGAGRLELLAVIRGLEALNQPSRVTLVTSSRYVGGGLRYGLEQWRRSGWQWERFGVMTPISDGDYWQRLDDVLSYHVVECRVRSGERVPDELAGRFRVQRQRPSADAVQQGLAEGSAAAEEDRHWPRRRRRWREAAAAMGTAAAAMGGLIWMHAS